MHLMHQRLEETNKIIDEKYCRLTKEMEERYKQE